jgi:hypothetical protein
MLTIESASALVLKDLSVIFMVLEDCFSNTITMIH